MVYAKHNGCQHHDLSMEHAPFHGALETVVYLSTRGTALSISAATSSGSRIVARSRS